MSYQAKAYQNLPKEEILKKIKGEGFNPMEIYNEPGYIYEEHQHPETKLLVFLDGSMEVKVKDEIFQCGTGDKLVIPGNTEHSAVVGSRGCRFFWSEKLTSL